MNITLVYAPAPREVALLALDLPQGATAQDALRASGWVARWPELGQGDVEWGVWGRKVPAHTPLVDGDRVTLLRALRV